MAYCSSMSQANVIVRAKSGLEVFSRGEVFFYRYFS